MPASPATHRSTPATLVHFISPSATTANTNSIASTMGSASHSTNRSALHHRSMNSESTSPNYATHGFYVRRTPRACHGACARLRPGRLRASHAVCLRYSMLEPALCARKEETDNESVSTTERIRSQSFAMRSLNPSVKTDSLHSSSASSTDFSASLQRLLRSEKTPNNGAAENRSGRLRSVTACASASGASSDSWRFSCAPPLGTGCASPEPPSAVSELESLGV